MFPLEYVNLESSITNYDILKALRHLVGFACLDLINAPTILLS